jgi:hypothetical protein
MKKLIFFLLTFHFSLFTLNSQPVIEEWVRRYPDTLNGWGSGNAITVDNKGYVYVTGTIIINNLMKYGTVKYGENGDVKWISIYEGNNTGGRQPSAIAVDESGNVFVTGYGYQTGNYFDFLTIKYDSLGNEKWVRFYDTGAHEIDQATGIKTDKAGNVYVTGYASLGGIHWVYCTIKYNTEGEELWIRQYGNPNSGTRTFAMTIDDKSNIYITGSDSEKVATVSYDSSGNLRWSNRYPFVSIAYSIAVDKDYNTFITGKVTDTLIHGYDYLTIKYSPSGQQLWDRRYTYCYQWGICDNIAQTVAVDRFGNIYVNGKIREGPNQNSICTIKYTTEGDTIWIRPSEHVYLGTITAMVIDSFSNIYVTAAASDTTLYNNITTYLTYKYDSTGSLIWMKRYNGNPQRGSIPQCLAVDFLGNVYVSGLGRSQIFPSYDMTTVRYSQPLFGIKKISEKIPQNFKLYQNFPNPFNPSTVIKFSLPYHSNKGARIIKIILYDILGRKISVLVDEQLRGGGYEVGWDASNYTSGIYFYQLIADGNLIDTKKLVLIK